MLNLLFFAGFPERCFDATRGVPKRTSISIHLTEQQFNRQINEWFPLTRQSSVSFYKLNQRRQLLPFEIRTPLDLHNTKYQGMTIIKNNNLNPAIQIQPPLIPSTESTEPEMQPPRIEPSDHAETEMQTPSIELTEFTEHEMHPPPINSTGHPDPEVEPPLIESIERTTEPEIQPRPPIESLRPTVFYQNDIDTLPMLLIERDLLLMDMTATQQVLVSRENLFEQALDIYKDESILECRLYVAFKDEDGDDFAGLTREFFSLFWKSFFNHYCKGHTIQFIELHPQNIPTSSVCLSSGRIMLHGFILTGYLPINLNSALILSLLTSRDPSKDLLLECFLKSFTTSEEQFLKRSLNYEAPFSPEERMRLANIFCHYPVKTIPSSSTILKEILCNLSSYVTVVAPYFMLHKMKTVTAFTKRITETVLLKYIDNIRPNGGDIAAKLRSSYSEEPDMYAREEIVFGFVERYVGSLDANNAQHFMKFVSGCETSQKPVGVTFNSLINSEEQLPKAHTCSVELEVSRFIISYEQLETGMNNILASPSASEGFHFV